MKEQNLNQHNHDTFMQKFNYFFDHYQQMKLDNILNQFHELKMNRKTKISEKKLNLQPETFSHTPAINNISSYKAEQRLIKLQFEAEQLGIDPPATFADIQDFQGNEKLNYLI